MAMITTAMVLLSACELKLKPYGEDGKATPFAVQRYDRLESRYLTTGDFSALQQMNIDFPMETRTLIEDVLHIGEVNDPEINTKFLKFYQDTTLQSIIADAEAQYANMSDINEQLGKAFGKIHKIFPEVKMPIVYSQIGAFDQSIIIGDNAIGISLDKYLGADYPLYKKYYSPQQRATMSREYIVPDCLCFFLLSEFPMKDHDTRSQYERDMHMGKIMWVVNRLVNRNIFRTRFTAAVEKTVHGCNDKTIRDMLTDSAR